MLMDFVARAKRSNHEFHQKNAYGDYRYILVDDSCFGRTSTAAFSGRWMQFREGDDPFRESILDSP
jgi:hypothetical protein